VSAADSLGLLKNVRALQSPREGVERKSRRDLISNSWGEVSKNFLQGCLSTQNQFPVCILPGPSLCFAMLQPGLGTVPHRRGLFPLLPGQAAGKEGKKELGLKELRGQVGREGEGNGSQTWPLCRASRAKHWEQLGRDLKTGPPKQKGRGGRNHGKPRAVCQPARKKY